MWKNQTLACLSALDNLHALKETDNPMEGDINVSDGEFRSKHSEQETDDKQVYGLLMESMARYPIVEFRMPNAMSPSGAWKELDDPYIPKTITARHRLQREFDIIHIIGRGRRLVRLSW